MPFSSIIVYALHFSLLLGQVLWGETAAAASESTVAEEEGEIGSIEDGVSVVTEDLARHTHSALTCRTLHPNNQMRREEERGR